MVEIDRQPLVRSVTATAILGNPGVIAGEGVMEQNLKDTPTMHPGAAKPLARMWQNHPSWFTNP